MDEALYFVHVVSLNCQNSTCSVFDIFSINFKWLKIFINIFFCILGNGKSYTFLSRKNTYRYLTLTSVFSFVFYSETEKNANLFGPNCQLVSQYGQLNWCI